MPAWGRRAPFRLFHFGLLFRRDRDVGELAIGVGVLALAVVEEVAGLFGGSCGSASATASDPTARRATASKQSRPP